MRTCAYCPASIEGARPRARRCPRLECKRAFNRERMRAWQAKKAEELGTRYEYRFGEARAAYAKANPGRRGAGRAAKIAADERRRARKLGLDAEVFDRRAVFDRDGWVCGICREAVSPELAYPDPRSASLDHRVPLSLGGPHTRANTRCAHLDCNVRRGARLDPEDAQAAAF